MVVVGIGDLRVLFLKHFSFEQLEAVGLLQVGKIIFQSVELGPI